MGNKKNKNKNIKNDTKNCSSESNSLGYHLNKIGELTGINCIDYISGHNVSTSKDLGRKIPIKTFLPKYLYQSADSNQSIPYTYNFNTCMFCDDFCLFRYKKNMLIYEEKIGPNKYNEIVKYTYTCDSCRSTGSDISILDSIYYDDKIWIINNVENIITGRLFAPKFLDNKDSIIDGEYEDDKCFFCGEWCAGSHHRSRYERFTIFIDENTISYMNICDKCSDKYQYPGQPDKLYKYYKLDDNELEQIHHIQDSIFFHDQLCTIEHCERVNS